MRGTVAESQSFAEALDALAQSTRAALAEDGDGEDGSDDGSDSGGARKKRKTGAGGGAQDAARLKAKCRKSIRTLIKSELKGASGRTMKAKALRKAVLAKLRAGGAAGDDVAQGLEKKELKALFQSELESTERDKKVAVSGKSVSLMSKGSGVASFGFPAA